MATFLSTLSELERRYEELDHLMADPEVATDPVKLTEYSRERAELDGVVNAYRDYRALDESISETEAMTRDDDREIAELAEEELKELRGRHDELLERIRLLL